MNIFPTPFEERMKIILQGEAETFFNALQSSPPVSIRFNPDKCSIVSKIFPEIQSEKVAWCPSAFYLDKRPVFTLDPYFHAGGYYVQEASSMFLDHILQQILPSQPIRALDLCAAPGGKSTLLASALPHSSLLVSNEVIRSRAGILQENIIKWGHDNIVVTNNDPADFSPLKSSFDLILVDAPCSGEGMFRKDPGAIREWSENNQRLCSERQQRILSNIWSCLKPGGFLIYSTCTYNHSENETILEWLVREFPAQSIPINFTFSGITPGDSIHSCYRFYPHKIRGEGFFIGVVQKTEGERAFTTRKSKKTPATHPVQLSSLLQSLIRHPETYTVYENNDVTGIVPAIHADFIRLLEASLNLLYKGCEIAETNNRKLKLLPALALWQGLNKANCSIYETDRDTALKFLKKEDISGPVFSGEWLLISYKNLGLGWCKNLGNRLNNYYPKEWRIRMQLNS